MATRSMLVVSIVYCNDAYDCANRASLKILRGIRMLEAENRSLQKINARFVENRTHPLSDIEL